MTIRAGFSSFRAGFLTCLLLLCLVGRVMAAESINSSTLPPVGKEDSAGSQDALRSFLQIQDQLHNTQMTLEKNRQEAEAAAARNAEMVEGRLSQIEKSMASQRLEELKDLQRSNRSIMIAAGVFAVIAFLVLLFTAFLQWSAVNRLATVASTLPAGRALGVGHTPVALGMGETQVVQNGPMEQSTTRFLEVIDRLEKRIHEMEHSLKPQNKLTEGISANGNGESRAASSQVTGEASNPEPSQPAVSEQAGTIIMLLGKAQTLLKLDQPENALACYNEVLELDPDNTEALVKKGTALERLQRLNEAIACYDRAIATDNSMTMAYLYKGGVFNQMERYSEALECYEKALQTQEKSHAA